uniref:Syntaxin-16 n=1 Tax=Papio anubis TaxID=9555 RepID=A0A8I5P358_PAPAN
MATRRLTDAFLLLRNNSIQNRQLLAEQLADDRMALVSGISLDPEAAIGVTKRSPPKWVDGVDEIQYDVGRIKQKMKELASLHDKHLNRPTLDDSSEEEHAIEITTQEITQLFHRCQRAVQALPSRARACSEQEGRLLGNVVASLAQALQELSTSFRHAQSGYLKRMKNREERSQHFFDTSVPLVDDGDDHTLYHRGFTDDQLVLVEQNTLMVEEREREIRQIVQSISDLNEIFRDLGAMIVEQGTVLDRIDYNVEQSCIKTEDGLKQLHKAGNEEETQNKRSSLWNYMEETEKALAGCPEHAQPQPHGQLSPLPELRHRGCPALQGEPAQQPLSRPLHHAAGADLPAARSTSLHCDGLRAARGVCFRLCPGPGLPAVHPPLRCFSALGEEDGHRGVFPGRTRQRAGGGVHIAGIYGVGKAALHPPALAVLSHTPDGATQTIAWVGKGIVYDTGGLSIKGKTTMPGMKRDCGGAAAVLGAFRAAIKQGFRDNLHAVFCLAENSVGPNATRPDDIHLLYSGKTVEINNTDAEGRLVLADGVSYACKDLGADIILDMATLTGAQGIATGKYHAAVLTNSAEWEAACVKAGRKCGDLVHPLVYCPELHFSEFTSAVADMKNSVADRDNSPSSCAGLFIASHIGFDWPGVWVHLDIAAPVHAGERATGFGVALLLALFGRASEDPLLNLVSPLGCEVDVEEGDVGRDSKRRRLV